VIPVKPDQGVGSVGEDADHCAATPDEPGTVSAGSCVAVQEFRDRDAASHLSRIDAQLTGPEGAACTYIGWGRGWLLRRSA
jgi:hypothetical protein